MTNDGSKHRTKQDELDSRAARGQAKDRIGIKAMLTRNKEIAKEISDLEREKAEIAEALKVLKRYAAAERVPRSPPKSGARRPSTAPTNFEMTKSILEASPSGLTGPEIVEEIGRRYWPGVNRRQILPAIYKFAKDGKLRKEAGRFYYRVSSLF